ncbi:glycoside hydrolase family 36 protein [Puniceicoccus vermicola]|uniref:Alpha-galactosidase n=1 Tax=Puniceicoccus vermicola TaxID=388746 RepID=A0A7X1B086_9BACT|nr:glycoside hydrolase family 36 protein [Puniceicoccus vermicola]MBC2603221.1 alpha-galactosidase [Puniceicoccus vermicola]
MRTEFNLILDTEENGLHIVIEKGPDHAARLLHFSSLPFEANTVSDDERLRRRYTLVEVHCTGENQHDHHGGKHTGSNCGGNLPRFVALRDSGNAQGRKLEIEQVSDRLLIVSHIQFFDGIPVARCWTELTNTADVSVGIEYVASFALVGITKEQGAEVMEDAFLHVAHNSWKSEFQWRRNSLAELGLTPMSEPGFSLKSLAFSNTGTWAAKEFLPMGIFETPRRCHFLFWQIESHASWHWEVGDISKQLYLHLSGPTERENQWWKNLQPGESFASIPVAVGACTGKIDAAFNHLNTYRRTLRRDHFDNHKLPVVFNDYMNCLRGDPTTEKLLPLIDKAAAAGAEYFVIDAGWYHDGPWWSGVGEWLPAKKRFPGGIEEPLDYIREKGMEPGLWLEIERVGINCRLATEWPDECFFVRHGLRVVDHDSLQLDFRHPKVRAHADEVVRRVVEQYGCKFIKMDYNIEIGPGTEVDADSFGDGLVGHQRAYRAWLTSIFERYPDLVIENCSSGAMRMTYGLMDLHTTSSTTDSEDYLMNARISINSGTAVCPEQAGVWAYPLMDATEESVIMNMVSAMSWRIYLSGQMQSMQGVRLCLIREAVECYKSYRERIPEAELIWPLGLPRHNSGWGAFGLRWGDEILLSVWRFEGEDATVDLLLNYDGFGSRPLCADCVYPKERPVPTNWAPATSIFSVTLPEKKMARIYRLKCQIAS